MPADAKGKRIRGVLRNGMRFGFEPVVAGAGVVEAGAPGLDVEVEP